MALLRALSINWGEIQVVKFALSGSLIRLKKVLKIDFEVCVFSHVLGVFDEHPGGLKLLI